MKQVCDGFITEVSVAGNFSHLAIVPYVCGHTYAFLRHAEEYTSMYLWANNASAYFPPSA